MSTEEKAYTLRPYTESDLNFIRSSWSQSYFDGTNSQKFLSPHQFNAYHRPIRDRILNKETVAIIVAANKEDSDHIIGWICVETPPKDNPHFKVDCLLAHYLYVKQAFRGEGIAKELIKRALPYGPVLMTHKTIAANQAIDKNRPEFKNFYFCPHLV